MTLLHGTLVAALTWLVTRLRFFRLRPALTFVLWALVLLKFFMPSGPALTSYGPSGLLQRAADALGQGGALLSGLWTLLLARPRASLGLTALITYAAIVFVLCVRWLRLQHALAHKVSALPKLDERSAALVDPCRGPAA